MSLGGLKLADGGGTGVAGAWLLGGDVCNGVEDVHGNQSDGAELGAVI